jgi:rhodanese-related sulfurtransferase
VTVQGVEVDELVRLRADGGVRVIDVRQPDEYEEWHIPGSELIPMADLPDRLDEIGTDETVYLVCRSGGRSHRSCEFLVGQGRNALNLLGGIIAWADAGHEVAEGSDPG